MKILVIVPEPFFEARGTPLSVYYRLKALDELDHKIDVITYHLGKAINIKNITIYRIPKVQFIKNIDVGPSFTKIFLDLILFFKTFLILIKEKYDCIHAHEEAAFMGCIFKKIFGIPLIYDMHSSIPQQLINFNFTKNRMLIKLAAVLEKWIIRNSDVVITISSHLEKMVQEIDPLKKVITIENVPIFELCDMTTKEDIKNLKKKFNIENNKVVLYTGTFEYYQGLDLLLKSAMLIIEKIKSIKFLLVGGEPKKIRKIRSLATSLDINDYIVITGKQPISEIPKFMEIADVLVSPRIVGTNVPLKIYTYLKSGKPMVATNIVTHTQVLDKNVALLVDPEPKAFAEGIIRILKDKKFGEKMGMEGIKLVNAKYGYDNFLLMTKQVCDYIRTLILG